MYEYVIVGAGSAGCVLANRLSEDPAVNVLLIEAGGTDSSELIHMPVGFAALLRTDKDWDYSSGYEPGCNNRRVYLPRGRVLGGSSSINLMVYIRGNPLDYDDFNGPKQDGVGWYQVTQRDGRRASTASCYLQPAMSRPNLHVETHVQVLKILFEGSRAVGVEGVRVGELVE